MTEPAVGPAAPPHNLEAEQAVLGALLFDNQAARVLPAGLRADHFYEPAHQRLFATITDALQHGRLANPTLISARMSDDAGLKELGGPGYLVDLMDRSPPTAHVLDHAQLVMDTGQRRDLIHTAGQIIKQAPDASRSAFDITADAEKAIGALLQDSAPDEASLVDARTAAKATVRRLDEEAEAGKPRGSMTGLRCFDRRLGGIRPGKLIILAGRPSMGKTGLARAGAIGCARRNPDKLVPFFTLEMDREEISERTLAQLSHEAHKPLPYRDMEGHRLDGETRAFLDGLADRVPTNFILDDTVHLTVEYVRRRLMTLKRRAPIAAAFIDYLQIMGRPDREGSNDAGVLGTMTAALKRTAREVGCGIVLLSQLSRQVEQRDNKRPMLSDLRESGAIEQDADAVIFAYREAYYLERQGPAKGVSEFDHEMRKQEVARVMEAICAKQRRGPVGADMQRYLAEVDVVEDMPE